VNVPERREWVMEMGGPELLVSVLLRSAVTAPRNASFAAGCLCFLPLKGILFYSNHEIISCLIHIVELDPAAISALQKMIQANQDWSGKSIIMGSLARLLMKGLCTDTSEII